LAFLTGVNALRPDYAGAISGVRGRPIEIVTDQGLNPLNKELVLREAISL